MNLTPEKLAERIMHHIWHELGTLSGLGNIKFNMSNKDKAEKLKSWIEITSRLIKEAGNHRKYLGFFDGSAKPNPGEMSIGGYILSPEGEKMYSYSINIGHGTNNVAEYNSLIHLLKECKNRGIQRILIRGDSQLIINQVTSLWKCKDPYMEKLCEEAQDYTKRMEECSIMWEPRANNKEADKLAQQGHGIPSIGG